MKGDTLIGVYVPEEGKEKKTTFFYQTLQTIIDKYRIIRTIVYYLLATYMLELPVIPFQNLKGRMES